MPVKLSIVVPIAGCLLALSTSTPGQDDDPVEEGVRCVKTRDIARTEIIDDRNILFHMRRGEIYRNELRRRCPGLAREERFMYRTRIHQLCRSDIITVLYASGLGPSRGPSCVLGSYHPISVDEAQALRGEHEHGVEPRTLPPAEPEKPELPKPGEDTDE